MTLLQADQYNHVVGSSFFIFSDFTLRGICCTDPASAAGRCIDYGDDAAVFTDYFSGINVHLFV